MPRAPTPPPAPAPASKRIGVLVDLEALDAEARTLGGELSFRRLLRGLGGEHTIEGAYCYATAQSRPAAIKALADAGFQVRTVTDDAAMVFAMAVDAMALAGRGGSVVIAPANPGLGPVIDALHRHGVRVVTAGFEPPRITADEHRLLGRDCIFVP